MGKDSKTDNIIETERTYVCSDLQGYKKKFKRLLKKIDFDEDRDEMIILGNVIGKGEDSIGLLQLIMSNPSFKMILGNREVAMLQALKMKDLEVLELWREKHDGNSTYKQYMELSEREQFQIIDYLGSRSLVLTNDKMAMVHAGFSINEHREGATQKSFDECIGEQTELDLYWMGEDFYLRPAFHDKVVLFGHTPVQEIRGSKDYSIWHDSVNRDKICVNTGVHLFPHRLGCLRIQDLKSFYVF